MLVDLQKAAHGRPMRGVVDLPILQTLQHHVPAMCKQLMASSPIKYVITALQTRENLPVALRATYPENQVALTKC